VKTDSVPVSSPEKTAEAWYYQHRQRKQMEPKTAGLKPIESIGIDELSLKKDTGNLPEC